MFKPFHITIHAIEQFIRRWEPNKNKDQAEEELDALLNTSRSVGKTQQGHVIRVSGHRPEIRMVIKEHNVCVTVLPPGALDAVILEYEQECISVLEELILETRAQIDTYESELLEINELRRELGVRKAELTSSLHTLQKRLRTLQHHL